MSYIVIRLDHGAPHAPRVKHETVEQAAAEAARLASKHPGSCFVYAEILGAFQTHPEPRHLDEADLPLKVKPA